MRFPSLCVALYLLLGSLAAPAFALRVVATIFPIADIVQQVGKEHVEVATLLPAGANPHAFEPTPVQVRAVSHADVFVQIGAGLDAWAAKLLAARSSDANVITLTDGLPLLGGTQDHGGDPHVWLDPILVRDRVVPSIVSGLSRSAPEQRAAFESAAAEFREALTKLDGEIRSLLTPLAHRNYIDFHAGWRYFGARYGLNELAVVERFPGKEPSAQDIAALVRKAQAAHVHALLTDAQFNPHQAEQIAREFGGRTVLVDPLGGPEVPGRSHYLDLMRYNSRAFVEALQ